MHHTDYNRARRNANHMLPKKTSTLASNDQRRNTFRQTEAEHSTDVVSKDLIYAALAAMLVIASLLQMDPANAQPHLPQVQATAEAPGLRL